MPFHENTLIEGSGEPDSAAGADRTAPMLLKIPAAARALSIGRTKTYELIARGEIEVVHIDGFARVPIEALQTYVERLRSDACGRRPGRRSVRAVRFSTSPLGDSQPPAA